MVRKYNSLLKENTNLEDENKRLKLSNKNQEDSMKKQDVIISNLNSAITTIKETSKITNDLLESKKSEIVKLKAEIDDLKKPKPLVNESVEQVPQDPISSFIESHLLQYKSQLSLDKVYATTISNYTVNRGIKFKQIDSEINSSFIFRDTEEYMILRYISVNRYTVVNAMIVLEHLLSNRKDINMIFLVNDQYMDFWTMLTLLSAIRNLITLMLSSIGRSLSGVTIASLFSDGLTSGLLTDMTKRKETEIINDMLDYGFVKASQKTEYKLSYDNMEKKTITLEYYLLRHGITLDDMVRFFKRHNILIVK